MNPLVLAVAQSTSINGNVERNTEKHLRLIDQAAKYHVDLIVFPELSITGYASQLAASLAFQAKDKRMDIFRDRAQQKQMAIMIGAPLKNEDNTLNIASFISLSDGSLSCHTKNFCMMVKINILLQEAHSLN